MSHNNINIKQLEVILIGLFLSRFDRDAIESLGFKSFSRVFYFLGKRLKVAPNSIKLYRDKFDPYYGNPRVGLNVKLPSLYKEAMYATNELPFEVFHKIVKAIIEHADWYCYSEEYNDHFNEIINSFFNKLEQTKQENDDRQMTYEQHNSDEDSEESETWHIVGNIKNFISSEKRFKNAYRNLLPHIDYLSYYEERGNKSFEETGNPYERWFLKSIENTGEAYDNFIMFAREVLTIINSILPNHSKLHRVVQQLGQTLPERNVMSCVCFYSAMMNVCEFVHLHRQPNKFKTGLMLINKAEKYLGLGLTHHIKVTFRLIRLCKINWVLKTINELRKLFGKNIFYKPTKLNALDALELSIPLAKCAYDEIYMARLQKVLRLYGHPCTLSNGFKLKDGKIKLPLGLKGYVADCPGVNRIVIGFRGTANLWNVITDLAQYLVGVSLVYKMALGLLLEFKEIYPKDSFWVLGHSLGGGLTQFAVVGMDNNRFIGFGYNSAGLSNMAKKIFKKRTSNNILHLHLRNDQVFFIGNQLGGYANQKSVVKNIFEAHKIETMERKRQYFYGASVKQFLDSILANHIL